MSAKEYGYDARPQIVRKVHERIEPAEHRFVETIGLRLKFVPTHEETDAVESEPGDPHEVFGDFARIEVAPHRRRAGARPIVDSY